MYTNTLRTTVHSQMSTMRRLLLDSIDHPELYMKGIEGARIVDFIPNGVIREIRKNGTTIKEGISIAERKNEFTLITALMEHPLYQGKIITRVIPASVQNPMSPLDLQVSLELELKSFKAEGMQQGEEKLVTEIKGEMEHLKKKAEELELHA